MDGLVDRFLVRGNMDGWMGCLAGDCGGGWEPCSEVGILYYNAIWELWSCCGRKPFAETVIRLSLL